MHQSAAEHPEDAEGNAGDAARTPSPLDEVTFRKVVGRFPTGVTIVTTLSGGVDHAMTVSSFASLSLDPLLVLICVEKIARFHDAVLDAGVFGVSILGEDGEEASRAFARRGRTLEGQFDRWSHRRGTLGLALFDAAVATLECRTTAVHDGGDHSIVVGGVVSARMFRAVPPLVYEQGRYRRMAP
ncbi:flavin reductase [Sphaerisporangium krabiense]|uniref:Flavin reductase (DIM6/NTAB) family NADH-FMN oxidoreductase RutF n=1 Tax=Sphaerisporangium krabiense TaxID=763782 RepID=A0A7W8Z4S0_9ACTN|nr:flavin reductase family protein [Sphaerisporangium krabiense]MBB5627449.1 flavin reductase (DIM6/NTAB) family NADH-FMN oxidoreductase RutF [Sphaerisporangium krabiense]GII64413.1 flavin reductase [Sphaerisporangium krabiense]